MNSTKENLQVLFEDNHIIIVNKRAGDITQGDKTGDKPLSDVVKEYVKDKYNKPGLVFIGTVHRLDRPTSGVVIFAKTSKILPRMNALFASQDAHKTYWALVQPSPKKKSETLTHWMVRNTKQNKSYAHNNEVPNAKLAKLKYSLSKELDRYSLLEIQLYTGRHHQIRAQLSAVGCCIKGDLKYGAARSNPDGSIHLHARHLFFEHPVKKTAISITAPTPQEALWRACEI